MILDWHEYAIQCIKKNKILPIFHGTVNEKNYGKIYLLKYLLDCGYSKDKIINWFKEAGGSEIEFFIDDLDDYIRKANNISTIERQYSIYITDQELEYIDNLDFTKEYKSFLLGMIVVAKFMFYKKKCPSCNPKERSYAYFLGTGKDKYNSGTTEKERLQQFIYNLQKNKIIQLQVISKYVQDFRTKKHKQVSNIVLGGNWIDFKAQKGHLIKNLEKDTKKLCNTKLHNKKMICSQCKRVFYVSNKNKTTLCPRCYNKSRNIYKRLKDSRKSHH